MYWFGGMNKELNWIELSLNYTLQITVTVFTALFVMSSNIEHSFVFGLASL
jgi:hypothetical protein